MLCSRGVTIVDFSVREQPASRPEPHGTSAAAEAGTAGTAAADTAGTAVTDTAEEGAAVTGAEEGAAVTAAEEGAAVTAAGGAEAGVAGADAAAVEAETGVTSTAAVAKELYRRGLLSAAWDVGPATAARAIQGGHIQRVLVRRWRAKGDEDGEGYDGQRPTKVTPPKGSSGEEREQEAAALRAMVKLCGKKGVCVRRDGTVPRGAGEKNFTEVLLPVASFRQSGSSASG